MDESIAPSQNPKHEAIKPIAANAAHIGTAVKMM
jgi:hypothetical protein